MIEEIPVMLRKKQRICPLATAAHRYGCAVPPILLLAAVLAAENVSFVLVGGAALYLYGYLIPVADIDAVPAPDAGNLARLHAALAVLVRDGRVPSIRSLRCGAATKGPRGE
jgi:hypothetical protein